MRGRDQAHVVIEAADSAAAVRACFSSDPFEDADGIESVTVFALAGPPVTYKSTSRLAAVESATTPEENE